MYISMLLPPGVALSPDAAALLLGYALRRKGSVGWGGAVAEVHPAPRGTLLLLRPAVSARLADYALPFVHKHFTD